MINIDNNVFLILICILIICSYCTITKILSEYSLANELIRNLEEKDKYIISCGNGTKIWRYMRVITVLFLIIIPYYLLRNNHEYMEIIASCVVYVLALLLHFVAYHISSIEYYVNDEGLWIKTMETNQIPWEQVVIEREWFKKNNKFQRIKVENRIYTIVYSDKKCSDEDIVENDDVNFKFEHLSFKEIKRQIIAETLLITVAIIIIVFCGMFTARNTGYIPSEFNKVWDYQKVYSTEQAIHAKPETIYVDKQGLIYASKEGYACLNVYNEYGEFLYAYHPPMGFDRGDSEFAVEDGFVYIKNTKDEIFVYNEKNFIDKIDETEIRELSYAEENTEKGYTELLYGDRFFIGFEGVIGVLIGIFLYAMSSSNLNSIWSYLLLLEQQNYKKRKMK